MKYLVCVSKTPDTTAKVSFKEDNKVYNGDGVQYIMNPYDEWYALVRALELKETNGGDLVLINVGESDNDTIIRKGLAIGGDRAVRINGTGDSAYVAAQIAQYAQAESFDIIFTGKETIDYNGAEVPAMIAEALDIPFVGYASKLELNGSKATITRDIEGGVEVVEVSTPFVISAAKGLAEQRIPNMRGIMMAKSKALDVVEPQPIDALTAVAKYDMPPPKATVKMIDPDNMEELVRALHEDSKVI